MSTPGKRCSVVNDEDREFGRNYQGNHFVDLEKAHAMSRERIEARVREEVTANLADQINTRDRRIESLDSKLDDSRVLSHAWTAWAKKLTGLCGVGSDAMRGAIEEQLAAAESARDHAISFQAANVARCAALEDALEKAERKIADARPVLTDEERRCVEEWRGSCAGQPLISVIDRLCPPPKAPPSDAELAKLACDAADRAQHGTDAWHALASIADALRNRGAK